MEYNFIAQKGIIAELVRLTAFYQKHTLHHMYILPSALVFFLCVNVMYLLPCATQFDVFVTYCPMPNNFFKLGAFRCKTRLNMNANEFLVSENPYRQKIDFFDFLSHTAFLPDTAVQVIRPL